MKTELSLTEFHLRRLCFISWRNPSHTVQGEVCLQGQKILNTLSCECHYHFEWMNLCKYWADPLNSTDFHPVATHGGVTFLFYYPLQFVICSWAILMSLAWKLPFISNGTLFRSVIIIYFVLPPCCWKRKTSTTLWPCGAK